MHSFVQLWLANLRLDDFMASPNSSPEAIACDQKAPK
jgi:hypothetical protein